MPLTGAPLGVSYEVSLEIVSGDRLEQLRDEWFDLWRACEEATPFQSPGWLLPWARHYAPWRCRAATLRSGGRLIALLPVFSWQGSLLLAGTGPTDYGDGLFLAGAERSVARMLSVLNGTMGHRFSRIDLQQLRPESRLLGAAAPKGWFGSSEEAEACPVTLLRGPDGMDAVSARWRSNWRYSLRRIRREGGTVDLVQADESSKAVADLERLHELRWREHGEAGVLSDPLLCRLLRSSVPELAAAGLLRLHRLRFGDETVALLLALTGHRRTFYYLSGFDPAYAALSPGTALVGAAISHAAQEGATEFHFLRGREAYKYRWGAEDRITYRRILTRVDADSCS